MSKSYEAITLYATKLKLGGSVFEYSVNCAKCDHKIIEEGAPGDAADKARKHGWQTKIPSLTQPAIWICPKCLGKVENMA